VRNVCSPGAAASYVCHGCYQQLAAVETRAVAVERFHSLFMECPRVTRSGGAAALRAAPTSPIGAVRADSAQVDDEPEFEGPLCECGRPLADNWLPHATRSWTDL